MSKIRYSVPPKCHLCNKLYGLQATCLCAWRWLNPEAVSVVVETLAAERRAQGRALANRQGINPNLRRLLAGETEKLIHQLSRVFSHYGGGIRIMVPDEGPVLT